MFLKGISNFEDSGSTFEGNAATSGGCISGETSTLTLVNSIFKKNWARNGGMVEVQSGSLTASGMQGIENKADIGGGLYMVSNSKFDITGGKFDRNTALSDASAIYSLGNSNVMNGNWELDRRALIF